MHASTAPPIIRRAEGSNHSTPSLVQSFQRRVAQALCSLVALVTAIQTWVFTALSELPQEPAAAKFSGSEARRRRYSSLWQVGQISGANWFGLYPGHFSSCQALKSRTCKSNKQAHRGHLHSAISSDSLPIVVCKETRDRQSLCGGLWIPRRTCGLRDDAHIGRTQVGGFIEGVFDDHSCL